MENRPTKKTNASPIDELSFDNTAIAFAAKDQKALKLTYRIYQLMNYPWLVGLGTKVVNKSLSWGMMKNTVKNTLYRHFCGGETLSECAHFVDQLWQSGVYSILGYSVEGKATDEEYDKATQETIRYVRFASQREAVPFAAFKITGVAPFALLEKIQRKQALTEAEELAWEKAKDRVDAICAAGYEHNVRILIDAEETWIQDPIDEVADAMMDQYNREQVIVYNTYQMYLQRGLTFLQKSLEKSKANGYTLGAKVVRGAYVEKERNRAKEMGYDDPLNPTKNATDEMYNQAVEYCLQNLNEVALFAGTHNEQSCYNIAQLTQKLGIAANNPQLFFGQLYGMSDNITFNLAKAGFNVIKYVPYGTVQDVMPYLFRRAQENTAIAGQSNREYELVKKEIKRRKNAGK